jgi:large subunit ribosomal protein LX
VRKMKKYEVKGTYKTKGVTHNFSTNLTAENEKMAKEKIYSVIGGKQSIRRNDVKIIELKVA